MKKVYAILVLVFVMMFATACNTAPSSLTGKYEYTSTSWIQLYTSTVDFENVYLGWYQDDNGDYYMLFMSGTGLDFNADKISTGVYEFTAEKEYNNGYISVTGYLYDSDTDYILLVGRRYNKV
ncbi:MAG: hypothetical protein AB7U79_05270 [Candidatus Izemoplasmatales bacterium]